MGKTPVGRVAVRDQRGVRRRRPGLDGRARHHRRGDQRQRRGHRPRATPSACRAPGWRSRCSTSSGAAAAGSVPRACVAAGARATPSWCVRWPDIPAPARRAVRCRTVTPRYYQCTHERSSRLRLASIGSLASEPSPQAHIHLRLRRGPPREPRRQRLLRPVHGPGPVAARHRQQFAHQGQDRHRGRAPHGRGRRRVGGARGDLAAVLRRQGIRRGARRGARPRQLSRLPGDADRGLRRMRAHARARWSHRGERGQPGSQAVPVAVSRCDRHPPGPPGPAAPGRGDLAQGAWRQRVVRVGLVPEPRQPGPPGPHRAGRHRQQGPLRPGPVASGAPGTAACRRGSR